MCNAIQRLDFDYYSQIFPNKNAKGRAVPRKGITDLTDDVVFSLAGYFGSSCNCFQQRWTWKHNFYSPYKYLSTPLDSEWIFFEGRVVFLDSKTRTRHTTGARGYKFELFQSIFNYIEQFSRSILLYLHASRFILIYLGLSRTISD